MTEPIVHTTDRRSPTTPTTTIAPTKTPVDFLPEINLVCKELPSKSIPYPKNVEIKYRSFMLGEVKKISESKNLSIKDRMEILLEGISVVGMDKYDLTLYDFKYISLLRKISTLGDRPLTAQYTCGKCYTKGAHIFELSALEFDDIKAPDLPVKFNLSKLSDVQFTPMTIRGFLDLVSKGKEEDDIAVIAMSCINKEYNEIYKAVYEANLDDVDLLAEVDDVIKHGVKPVTFKCKDKNCTNEMTIEVDGEDTLFMPFRRSEKHSASRLSFGA